MATRGKSWGETKETTYKNESWDKKVDWFQFPNNEEVRIRLVGPVYILGRHWPAILTKFVFGQKPKVFPAWCTKFDSVAEEANPERICPLCDDFDMYLEKLAVCNVIIRKYQEGKNRRGNPVVPVIWRHSDVDKVFKKAFEKYKADPADPKKGCDFSVEYDPNNKKNRWTLQREDQTPLTPEEMQYELTDFESLIPDYEDSSLMAEHAREMKKSIARSGYYVIPLKNGEDGWAAYKSDVNGKPYTAYPDLVAVKDGKQVVAHSKSDDDDDGMPAPRRHRVDTEDEEAPVSKPASKPPPAEEEEKPARQSGKTVAAKAPPPAEEEEEETPEEEEESPPPPPKQRVSQKTPPPVEIEDEEEKEPPKPAPKAASKKDKEEAKTASVEVPAKHEVWSKKFGIVWASKSGKVVPSCKGEYVGAKKCTTCPESAACIEESDSSDS